MDELNSFLKELGIPEESLLDKPLTETEPEKEGTENKGKIAEVDEDGYPKNRQGRRKRQHDEDLRNEVLQLNERVKVLSELGRFKEEVGDDPLKKIEAIFGTDTPEKLAATNLLKEALTGIKESAKSDVIKEWESREGQETEAQKEADDEVETMLEQVEDEYGLDMSDDNVRRGFITLMEKMSSKHDDGNIKEFADADAVAETYVALQKRQGSSKAKELSSRSMTHSGESQPSRLPQNAVDRFMEENGFQGNW